MTQLKRIHPNFALEGATFGEGNSQVIVFRLIGGPDEWEQVPGTRFLVIGGQRAKKELRRLVDARSEGISRRDLQARGIATSGRSHHALRQWLGMS